ncbi:ATP-binding protein [Vagococcus sp.]|uniref:HAMP domain-containing sensor histidine kinase n=1 Tax=Vagococcus sp. TaxID=1933889 RepID=UPI003F9C728F
MRKSITHRLVRNFSFILILFSIVVFSVFVILFNQQSMKIYQEQMIEHGEVLANNLTKDIDEANALQTQINQQQQSGHGYGRRGMGGMHMGSTMRGYDSTIQLIQQMTGGTLWVVKKDGTPFLQNNGGHRMQIQQKVPKMTETSKKLLNQVIATGENAIEKEQTKILVGIPLLNQEKVSGAVLLESTIKQRLGHQFSDFSTLFISLIVALLLTMIMAYSTAKKFVKPIKQMETFTRKLSQENYSQQLFVKTEDELNRLADQLNFLGEQLQIAKYERENKELSQKRFLSQISHELRTPVMIIKNSLETLDDHYEIVSPQQQEYLTLLQNEAEQLEFLLNDLLELNRLQSTEFSIETNPVDLYEVIEDSLRAYRSFLTDKKQEVIFLNQLTQQQLIIGDYQRLAQLVRLLLDNAIKYSAPQQKIQLELSKTKQDLQIILKNPTQETLEQPQTQQLFETFKRGQHSEIPGHGLGLSIAQQIVKRHHGTIEIDQQQENDFVVRLTFPLAD